MIGIPDDFPCDHCDGSSFLSDYYDGSSFLSDYDDVAALHLLNSHDVYWWQSDMYVEALDLPEEEALEVLPPKSGT